MGTVKIVLNRPEVARLLKSAEILALLDRLSAKQAEAATANAGDGAVFGHAATIGASRARATVWTDNAEAKRAEAKDRVLLKAIDAGRV